MHYIYVLDDSKLPIALPGMSFFYLFEGYSTINYPSRSLPFHEMTI